MHPGLIGNRLTRGILCLLWLTLVPAPWGCGDDGPGAEQDGGLLPDIPPLSDQEQGPDLPSANDIPFDGGTEADGDEPDQARPDRPPPDLRLDDGNGADREEQADLAIQADLTGEGPQDAAQEVHGGEDIIASDLGDDLDPDLARDIQEPDIFVPQCHATLPCPRQLECRDGICGERQPCDQDLHCYKGRICPPQQHFCRDACGEGSCPLGTQCETNTQLCVAEPACQNDQDCPGTQSCDLPSKECFEPTTRCTLTLDCIEARVCVDDATRCVDRPSEQCETVADCPSLAWACDEMGDCLWLGFCQNDADCPAWLPACVDQTCRPCSPERPCPSNRQTCQESLVQSWCEEPAMCLSDEDCLGSRVCLTSRKCGMDAECLDDHLEENDAPLQARPVVGRYYRNLALCNDEDWFSVELEEGHGLKAIISFDPGEADLDLTLYSAEDETTPLAESATISHRETVMLARAPQTGLYLLRILAFGRDQGLPSSAAYDLDVRVTPEPLCDDDGPDKASAGNDTLLTASPAPSQGEVLTLCPGDQDWYFIDLEDGEGIGASLTFEAALGDLNLQLLDPQGQLLAESATDRGQEAIATESLGPGRFYVRVLGVSPTTTNTYTLRARAITLARLEACDALPVLTLNAQGAARVTGQLRSMEREGPTCSKPDGGGPSQLYRFTLHQLSELHAELTGGEDMDTVLALLTSCESPFSELACNNDSIPGRLTPSVLTQVLAPGEYVLQAAGYEPYDEGPYTLDVRATALQSPGSNTCAAPAYHEINTGTTLIEGSTALATNTYLSECGAEGPDQVFQLHLTREGKLQVQLMQGSAPSLLSLRTDCPTMTSEIACGNVIDLPILSEGDYYLFVDGWPQEAGEFTLQVTLSGTGTLPDSCDTAEALIINDGQSHKEGDTLPGAHDFQGSCGAGGATAPDLVYAFTLMEGARVGIQVSPAAGFQPIISVLGDCENPETEMGCSTDRLDLTLPPQTYWVTVDGRSSLDYGAFALDLAVNPECVMDDECEGRLNLCTAFTCVMVECLSQQDCPGSEECLDHECVAIPPPVNDTCEGALDITGVGHVEGDTTYAHNYVQTNQGGCTPYSFVGKDVVYFVALEAGQSLEVTASPTSNFDLALYLVGDCNDPIATCLDGVDGFGSGRAETISLVVDEPQIVYIVVDSASELSWGAFELTVTLQ